MRSYVLNPSFIDFPLKNNFFYGKLHYLLAHALINNTRWKAGERSTPIKATRDDS